MYASQQESFVSHSQLLIPSLITGIMCTHNTGFHLTDVNVPTTWTYLYLIIWQSVCITPS